MYKPRQPELERIIDDMSHRMLTAWSTAEDARQRDIDLQLFWEAADDLRSRESEYHRQFWETVWRRLPQICGNGHAAVIDLVDNMVARNLKTPPTSPEWRRYGPPRWPPKVAPCTRLLSFDDHFCTTRQGRTLCTTLQNFDGKPFATIGAARR